jgi:hypothetical protein
MALQQILNPTMSDAQNHAIVKDWLAPACNVLIDHVWSMHSRKTGFVKFHMLRAFQMDQVHYDRDEDVEEYCETMGVPHLPMTKEVYFG